MAKKEKKISADQSIPIRVTNAKTIPSKRGEGKPLDSARTGEEATRAAASTSLAAEKTKETNSLRSLLSPEGDKVDMTKFVQANKTRRIVIRVIAILLALFLVTLAGFFVFTRQSKKFGKNVNMSIELPATASSGDVLTLLVRYKNNETISLKDVELVMQFPSSFTFQSSDPANGEPNSWKLGNLAAGAGGVVQIKGQLIGDVGAVSSFSGTLTYTPSNFNYRFEQEDTTQVTITTSSLSLTVDAPLNVVPKKEFTATIHYTNTSEKEIKKPEIILVSPDGFSFASSKPENDNGTWKFDSIESKKEGSITITGSIDGQVGDQKQFTVRMGFLDAQGVFQPQTEKQFLILLIKAGLALSVKADTKIAGYAEWGESVTYTLSYSNDGDVPLSNVVLTLNLNDETSAGQAASVINWDSVSATNGGKIQDSALTWDSKAISALNSLRPGDNGTVTATVPLLSTAQSPKEGDSKYHILAEATASQKSSTTANTNETANANSNGSTNTNSDVTTQSSIVETKIATSVGLTASAHYYAENMQQVGSGPLPPVVGQTTTYVIAWAVTNNSNDISNVTISATLPTGVEWANKTTISAGTPIAFDPTTRKVTWTINRIPSGAGTTFPKLEARFSVSITPTADQVGTFVQLVDQTTLSSTDVFVNVSRESTASLINTDLQSDAQARGKGIVEAGS